MKTIKEVANMCGMSKTSVNRAIDELKIEKQLSGNKNIVSDSDADRIVSLLRGFGKTYDNINTNQSKNETKSEQNETNQQNPQNSVNSEMASTNKKLIDFLMEQIKIKDKQIIGLQEENKMLIQAQAYTIKQLEKFNNTEVISVKEDDKTNDNETIIDNTAKSDNKKKWYQFWK